MVDFDYWLSCIGRGLLLQPAQLACFEVNHLNKNSPCVSTSAAVVLMTLCNACLHTSVSSWGCNAVSFVLRCLLGSGYDNLGCLSLGKLKTKLLQLFLAQVEANCQSLIHTENITVQYILLFGFIIPIHLFRQSKLKKILAVNMNNRKSTLQGKIPLTGDKASLDRCG